MSHRRFPRALLMLLPTFLFTLMFNSALLVSAPVFSKNFFVINVLGMFLAAGFSWALFLVLRINRILFAIALPLLFLLSAVGSYYARMMSLDFDGELLDLVLQAPPVEIRDYLSWRLAGWVFASLAAGIAVTWVCLKYERQDARDKMVLLMAAAFVVSACFNDGGVSRQYFPYNYLHALAEYTALPKKPVPVDISKEPLTLPEDMPKDLAVLVVVSNGVRFDHLQFNNARMSTTPRLGSRENLISFKNVLACGPFTNNVLSCLLSRASYLMPEDAYNESTLISVFRRQGFATAWIDMKGGALGPVAKEAEHIVRLNTSLLDTYKTDVSAVKEYDAILKANPGRVMTVVRLTGSSWPFLTRTPDRYHEFTPACDKLSGCTKADLAAAYNNSLLYTDYVVDALIKSLGERPALVIFTSTSGQALGEDGYVLHGHSKLHGDGGWMEKHVPIVLWASDAFVIQYTKRISNMYRHQSDDTITHDYIFHTVLDCIGFEGPIINKNLSLCR